jgi:L-alanine-DL-glutamate epimerase-like enolase superfamily enzyme
MPKSTDVRLVRASISFEPVTFRAPLKFGGRIMQSATLMNVEVEVETKGRKRGVGFGSMPVGQIWAWPSDKVSPEQAEQAMKAFAEVTIGLANAYEEFSHPIEMMYTLSAEYAHQAKRLAEKLKLPEPLPMLAQLVAASPLDAAVHDAYGAVHGLNSYDALSSKYMNDDLSNYLDADFKGEYLDKYTLREPKPRMPLYHLVGALDPLTPADVVKKIGDGLPETLGDWIAYNGLTHLKIKLNGDQLDWDVDRVLQVDKIATEAQAKRGCTSWFYSTDFNEKCASVDYVLDFFARIKKNNPQAFERIQYVEQPTNRDLKANPQNHMHKAAAIKPIVIDESLVDYESLLLAREQGYSGVALKACKGHTEALFAAAAAQKFGMFLCVQDLTCPGRSFLHSASLAARIPTIAAIEGNSRQYCPSANKQWARTFPGMFDIKDGTVATGLLNGPGLGY